MQPDEPHRRDPNALREALHLRRERPGIARPSSGRHDGSGNLHFEVIRDTFDPGSKVHDIEDQLPLVKTVNALHERNHDFS